MSVANEEINQEEIVPANGVADESSMEFTEVCSTLNRLNFVQDIGDINERIKQIEEEARKIREMQTDFSMTTSSIGGSPSVNSLSLEEKAAIDNRSVFVGNVRFFNAYFKSFAFRLITARSQISWKSTLEAAALLNESQFLLIVILVIRKGM